VNAAGRQPTAVWTVRELTRYLRLKLENDPRLSDVWVRGEISNFKHHPSGHMYFTLKDEESLIRSVMFAHFNRKLPFMPRDGMRVLVRGQVTVYDRDGQYQLYAREMQPDGIGSLFLAFEQLKRKLAAEGLFDERLKRPIPRFPRTVGVITSPAGAAVRDILTTLSRRFPGVRVIVYAVPVQGEQAAPAIVRAIETMNRLAEADVLIVGRGGGSLEELWAFNEEIVARSIRASAIPVISAVGHETDVTIADFAADLRAATPTAAAELAVPHHLELRQYLAQLDRRMKQGLWAKLRSERERLNRAVGSPVFREPQRLLRSASERLDRVRERLAFRMSDRLMRARHRERSAFQRLAAHRPSVLVRLGRRRQAELSARLLRAIDAFVRQRRALWASAVRQLDALSPLKVMSRGYGLVYDENETEIIRSVRSVQPGDLVRVRLSDGRLGCHVWWVEEERNEQRNGNGPSAVGSV